MSVDLTYIFGSEITSHCKPRTPQRQFTGYPGTHGVTAMLMGSRGRPLVTTGRLRAYGLTYAAARAALQGWIADIEAYQFLDAATYTYQNWTYYNVIFERFDLIPDRRGKVFHQTVVAGWIYLYCDFVCIGRTLF